MKNIQLLTVMLLSFMVSSCSVIGTIFKTGVGVGIFIAIAVVVVIVIIAMRAGKDKT